MSETNIGTKKFIGNVLSGTSIGIIVGLIPNAVLSAILKLFGDNYLALIITQVAVIFQLATPLIIGALVGMAFKFKPMSVATVAGAAFVASGVVKYNPELKVFVGAGTGDIANTMIIAGFTAFIVLIVGEKFGSLSIITTPILIGCGCGFVGMMIGPYVAKITTTIGHVINTFTILQPLFMSILISCAFALIIITPFSTVAIAIAIQLTGVAAGAAAMGVAATAAVMVVNSWKINKPGVMAAIALGAIKMMMPNLFRRPIILIPVFFAAALSGIPVAIFSISGVPTSAGFGVIGLVGPLAAMDAGLNVGITMICFFAVPLATAFVGKVIFEKMFKLYTCRDVFLFIGQETAK